MSTIAATLDNYITPIGLSPTLQRPTLVLNRNWQPINVATVARALIMLWNDSAKIVDPIVNSGHKLSQFLDVAGVAGGKRFAICGIRLVWIPVDSRLAGSCFRKSPHCRVLSSAMRLDQTRARSARWPTSILLLKPSLLKRHVGELVNVFVCMNVANGNSSQLIPSTGTAARNVTSRPGGGRCVERTRHIDEVSKGGFAVASSHKPIANVENSGQSKLNRRLQRHLATNR
jgi:hypothetical protein